MPMWGPGASMQMIDADYWEDTTANRLRMVQGLPAMVFTAPILQAFDTCACSVWTGLEMIAEERTSCTDMGTPEAVAAGTGSLKELRRRCANCNMRSAEVEGGTKACSLCKVKRYCSKECQLLHWKEGGHKGRCPQLKARREALERQRR